MKRLSRHGSFRCMKREVSKSHCDNKKDRRKDEQDRNEWVNHRERQRDEKRRDEAEQRDGAVDLIDGAQKAIDHVRRVVRDTSIAQSELAILGDFSARRTIARTTMGSTLRPLLIQIAVVPAMRQHLPVVGQALFSEAFFATKISLGLFMKLICDRLSLSDALTMASGVVASRTPRPVLLCLKLVATKSATGSTLQISATDGEIGLVITVPNVDVKEDGEALIPADKLNQIVRACDDTTVAISVDRTLATISTESSTFKVFGYEPREFPGVRKASDRTDFEVDAGTLRRLITRTIFATAREDTRYAFNGVLVERKKTQLQLVATDARRLAIAKGSCRGGGDADTAFVIPTKALNALMRLLSDPDALVKVAREGNQVVFVVGDVSAGATLVTNVDERTFPPFNDAIPKEHDRKAVCDAGELGGAIRRASLLTNEESKGVRLSFSGKQLTLTSRAPEMGESEVRIDGIDFQGEPIEIAFNPSFIVDVLKIIDSEQVIIEMKAPNKPGVIKVGNDFTYVVMPVSLQ